MKQKWLISWVGEADLRASEGSLPNGGTGPIAGALLDVSAPKFDKIHLLTNYDFDRTVKFCAWLEQRCSYPSSKVHPYHVELNSPIDYDEVYAATTKELHAAGLPSEDRELTFHLSPGTPTMAVIWVTLARTQFPAQLIQTARDRGVLPVTFHFDLANAFLPGFLQSRDDRNERLAKRIIDAPDPAFGRILYRSEKVGHEIDLARRYAAFPSLPILILGETGTGKEWFARAVHDSSARKAKKFEAVNCGAIPKELANSQLFGHTKGSFTGATANHKGVFEIANGGTLFLDEVGELPLDAQVRLLRVLQEGEVMPVGATNVVKVDVRIVAATHRNLEKEVSEGTFREDLFYRLAGGILRLPPLRERDGDLDLLVDKFLDDLNERAQNAPDIQRKTISPEARIAIAGHSWPGNIRELQSTLLRASVQAHGDTITAGDIDKAILKRSASETQILDRPFASDFSLQDVLDEVSRHYIRKAFQLSRGRKKRAAQYLGIKHFQTLDNRVESLGMNIDDLTS